VILGGIGRGLRFNTGSGPGSYVLGIVEPEVQRALADFLRPGMVVYDVGANVGFLAVIAARLVGPTGTVVCFEPLEANAASLAHNARLNGFSHVAVRTEALGRIDGPGRFLGGSTSDRGRLAADADPGGSPVSVRRLDTLVQEVPLPLPNLIKIDVEGTEADVLMGGLETFRRSRPVLLIEIHETGDPVRDILSKLGYGVRALSESQLCGVPS
jgi:FkbM family methyltransferase